MMTRFTVELTYMLFIVYCQYHCCWGPGKLRSQGISRYGINQISRNILSLASKGFIYIYVKFSPVRAHFILNDKGLDKMADVLQTTLHFKTSVFWFHWYFSEACPIDSKSALVQVVAWCSQVTSHYLNQCWPRSNLTRSLCHMALQGLNELITVKPLI